MLVLTVVVGLLAFPVAYQACEVEFFLTHERFTHVLLGYTAIMIAAATIGGILDKLYRSKKKPVKIDFSFVAGFAIILFLVTMLLMALKPVF